MTWRWLIYAAIFTCTTVFSKGATRMKRSDEDVNKPCEDGWYQFRQKCYIREKSAGLKSWNDAAYTCFNDHGGDLVSIHSKEELDFLVTYIILEYKYAVWIGFHNRAKQSEFSWNDNSPVNYTNWKFGNPTGDDTCTLMLYNLPGNDNVLGEWYDLSCEKEYSFVCQRKIGVDNCVLKCGNNPGVKCSGNRFNVKEIKCNCTEEGYSFDAERKECREDYCIKKCNEPHVECINRFDEEAFECKCKAAGLSFDGERKECREDYCIEKCGEDPDLLCVGDRFENVTTHECNCKRTDQVFDIERKKCKVDYCISKCGENQDLECVGDRFDKKAVVCNCSREGYLFDEEKKECRVDYCITKCNELPDVECINRFDEEAIECKCKAAGLSFDGERKECREDYCIEKCGEDPDLLCVGDRFENVTTIECNCKRTDQVFDIERKKCKVDYCIPKCGENQDLECVGDRFDEKKVVCNCSREGYLFDEEKKVCRVKHKDEELLKKISGQEYYHAMIGLSVTLILVLGLVGAAIFYYRRRRMDLNNLERTQAPFRSSNMSILELKATEHENPYRPMGYKSS